MNSFKLTSDTGFSNLRKAESWMEIGLAVAAAAFSMAIWFADGSRAGIHSEGAKLVTFPTVIVSAPR